VFDGLAYLCGPDGAVTAVDAHSGQHIWKTVTGGMITAAPAVVRGVVYLGSGDGYLYALEAKTGAIAWRRDLGGPLTLPVAVGDDQVYACGADGTLWALDAETGEALWRMTAEQPGAPVFAEVVVLAGGRAYDPANGQVLWRVDPGGADPVARLDQVIYPGAAVDLFTGSLQRAPVGTGAAQSHEEVLALPAPPTPLRAQVASGPLLIGIGADERLHACDAADGRPLWLYALAAPCHQPPAVAPGQIVVALANGGVQTFRFQRTQD
jgi:outer membrane protein assembly factor BamB